MSNPKYNHLLINHLPKRQSKLCATNNTRKIHSSNWPPRKFRRQLRRSSQHLTHQSCQASIPSSYSVIGMSSTAVDGIGRATFQQSTGNAVVPSSGGRPCKPRPASRSDNSASAAVPSQILRLQTTLRLRSDTAATVGICYPQSAARDSATCADSLALATPFLILRGVERRGEHSIPTAKKMGSCCPCNYYCGNCCCCCYIENADSIVPLKAEETAAADNGG